MCGCGVYIMCIMYCILILIAVLVSPTSSSLLTNKSKHLVWFVMISINMNIMLWYDAWDTAYLYVYLFYFYSSILSFS